MEWWISFWTSVIPATPLVVNDGGVYLGSLGLLLLASLVGLWVERDRAPGERVVEVSHEVDEVVKGDAVGCAA